MEQFISAGVDSLAPSVGNIHGEYGPKGPELDMQRYRPQHLFEDGSTDTYCYRLQRIFKALNGRARLVLHGTNDFPPELAQACIRAGVTKFNVNKLVFEEWYAYIRANVHKPLTQTITEGVDILAESMGRWMDIVGSSGKA